MLPRYELDFTYGVNFYFFGDLQPKLPIAVHLEAEKEFSNFVGVPALTVYKDAIRFLIDGCLMKFVDCGYLRYDEQSEKWLFNSEMFAFDKMDYDIRSNIINSSDWSDYQKDLLCYCLVNHLTGKFYSTTASLGAERIEILQKFFNNTLFNNAVQQYTDNLILHLAQVPEEK